MCSATFQGRKINFTNSKKLWWASRPTVTRVSFDLPECKEPEYFFKKMKRNAIFKKWTDETNQKTIKNSKICIKNEKIEKSKNIKKT